MITPKRRENTRKRKQSFRQEKHGGSYASQDEIINPFVEHIFSRHRGTPVKVSRKVNSKLLLLHFCFAVTLFPRSLYQASVSKCGETRKNLFKNYKLAKCRRYKCSSRSRGSRAKIKRYRRAFVGRQVLE